VMPDPDRTPTAQRFWRGFGLTATVVAIYTLVGMGFARSKMQSADKSTDLIVFGLVALVYGAVAGCVAGFASTVFKGSVKTS